jgi:septal ring factor EnvC (AmiA/AmiB activator)
MMVKEDFLSHLREKEALERATMTELTFKTKELQQRTQVNSELEEVIEQFKQKYQELKSGSRETVVTLEGKISTITAQLVESQTKVQTKEAKIMELQDANNKLEQGKRCQKIFVKHN